MLTNTTRFSTRRSIDTLVPVAAESALSSARRPHIANAAAVGDLLPPAARPHLSRRLLRASTRPSEITPSQRASITASRTCTTASLVYQMGRRKNLRTVRRRQSSRRSSARTERATLMLSLTRTTIVFSARLVNQTRFQFSRLTPAVASGRRQHSPGRADNFRASTPFELICNNARTRSSRALRLPARPTAAKTAAISGAVDFRRGAHSLKFGGDVQRIRSTFIDLSDASGTFNFAARAIFCQHARAVFARIFRPNPPSAILTTGIFVQDDCRLRRI